MSIEIHMPKMIHKELLEEHPKNANKQSRFTFSELRESIQENGFDENLIAVPKKHEDGYYVVSGNHRFRAGVAEGMTEFPCVVHEDWDSVKEQIELVRRNFVRGEIDKDTFTIAVNTLSEEHSLSVDDIRDMMGFEDAEVFSNYYNEQEDQQQMERDSIESTTAPQVKMLDDLGVVLSNIFEQYGDTVPYSFIVFPAGGKNHMYIAATTTLRTTLEEIADHCIANNLDINIALGGLLQIGMQMSKFKTDLNRKEIEQAGNAHSGSSNFSDKKENE